VRLLVEVKTMVKMLLIKAVKRWFVVFRSVVDKDAQSAKMNVTRENCDSGSLGECEPGEVVDESDPLWAMCFGTPVIPEIVFDGLLSWQHLQEVLEEGEVVVRQGYSTHHH
jgi:hypothetical protein